MKQREADILPKIGSNRFQTSFVIATPNLITFQTNYLQFIASKANSSLLTFNYATHVQYL